MSKVAHNRLVLGIVCVFIVFILGCDKINELKQPSSTDVLNSYLSDQLAGRSEEAYKYISTEDKAVKSLNEYKSENTESENPFVEIVKQYATFKVGNVKEAGKSANATVELTIPDVRVLLKDFFVASLGSALKNKDKSVIQKEFAKRYGNGTIPTVTKSKEFQMVKEDSGWKVFLDWKAAKLESEKNERIKVLISEATKLRESDKFSEAIEKLKEVLVLDSDLVKAQEAIDAIKQQMIEAGEKQKYLDLVELYGVKSKYYKTYSDDRVPGVEFKLKNKGDRTLKTVQVTVFFKNEDGTVIAEEKYHPVLVSKYSVGRKNKPLKPNYIWQMERDKFYVAKSVPTEWKEGAISAEITEIEFLN
ncbi:hypothetical protein [Maridesulfovibrio sp.]|uniref:hypothetical protein n=1 Tax=Maridesulfovibrio sp. TaxID=2795000 RepID=UPI0039EF39EF